ncbi:hypothetical protein OPQ81_004469 [Rhizoctonia solani]|nr:hypothetical protein OPQ81_004469 [Rhizoctonia solani]
MAAQGQCSMRGKCGTNYGKPLPCPYDGPPQELDQEGKDLLSSVCGPKFAEGPVCCTADQIATLKSNFQTPDQLVSSCPACKNNFHEFYCHFTCSPYQAEFVTITSTGEGAVKSVDFRVTEEYGTGFYDSCKDVKFGGLNDNAMTLIGGGATNYHDFLKYMGAVRPIGSPFQINFPQQANSSWNTPLNAPVRDCTGDALDSRCTCLDCPGVCPTLPDVPGQGPTCMVGAWSCLTFSLVLVYALGVLAFLIGYLIQSFIRRRRRLRDERHALSAEAASVTGALVGAGSLQRDGTESTGTRSESRQNLGRGASLLDPLDSLQPRQHRLNTHLRRGCYKLGLACATHPWLTFTIVFALVGVLNLGWTRFEVETDPVRLWVAHNSELKQQKEYFDEHFGPFYKTEQLFITNAQGGPVMNYPRLKWWLDIENEIRQLKSEPNGYSHSDVCFKPAGPRGACVVQSVGVYFGGDMEDWGEDGWVDQLEDCASQPAMCLPDFGQPLAPKYVLGSAPKDEDGNRIWHKAEAMVVTFVVSDSLDATVRERAEEWERTLRAYLEDLSARSEQEVGVKIAFSTGVSLTEELNKSTNTDKNIVILSYLVMFFYIALTLGKGGTTYMGDLLRGSEDRRISSLFTGTKFALGLFGIALVLASVSTSVGIFSFLGVRVTLIIAEVIPFLVLAVGVDNVFILVHELDRQNSLHGPGTSPHTEPDTSALSPLSRPGSIRSRMSPEERVARAVARMGPSIALSTLTETTAFALGALVPMPAVRNFALYAAGSVFVGACLQATAFVSALALDLRRAEARRVDCIPCIRLGGAIALEGEESERDGVASLKVRESIMTRCVRRYAVILMKRPVKALVMVVFAGIFVLSVVLMQKIELGLDQRLALPSSSYLVPYFNALDQHFAVGPPVYFVSRANASVQTKQQQLCAKFTSCSTTSIANVLEAERKRSQVSYIADPPASWIDDFFYWLNPEMSTCCRVRRADPSVFCGPRDRERLCRPCFEDRVPEWNVTLSGMPEGDEFVRYLKQWLISPTDEDCPLGGRASYGSALSIQDNTVEASHFRTFHAPLKTQADFINALSSSKRIAAELSESTGSQVFAYSLPYVFFEQYATIVSTAQGVLGLGLAAVLIITGILLGSWRTGVVVTGRVMLNAISLVNLVIALGIAVEFCAHVARAFVGAPSTALRAREVSIGVDSEVRDDRGSILGGVELGGDAATEEEQRERDERVVFALADVGPSVLSGITFTKLIGMCVLGLTRSRLLEIYYFRMWSTLIVSGALHGLVLLPVILSVAGGPAYSLEDQDEEWINSAMRRQDYEYAPFVADDDESVHED